MASTELLSTVGVIGTIAGFLMYLLWVRHAEDTSLVWLRFIGSIILGGFLGYLLGCIFATKDTTTIYVAVSLGFVISFLMVCLGLFSTLFALIPKPIQTFLRIFFTSFLAIFVFAVVFGKTVAWLIKTALILGVLWIIRAIAYRFIPESIQKVINIIIVIAFVILLIKVIFNNLIKSVIAISIIIVLALKVD